MGKEFYYEFGIILSKISDTVGQLKGGFMSLGSVIGLHKPVKATDV